MAATGVHQWFPDGRWGQSAILLPQATWVAWQLPSAEGLAKQLLGIVLVISAAAIINANLSYRVRADDEGLYLRGAWWRTRDVPWSEVRDVRPRRDRPGSPLLVQTRAGLHLNTHLQSQYHQSLVAHWRVMTAQASLEDYVTAGYDGSR